MSQLLELAIDELKIDKSFVLGLASDPRARAIVRSAIELARALHLTVVAEGIESEKILQSLQDIGADVGQGYVIAYPLTSRELEEYPAQPARRLLCNVPQLSSVSPPTSGSGEPPLALVGAGRHSQAGAETAQS